MYSECISLSEDIQQQTSGNNVLSSFSKITGYTGHDVVLSVIKPLEELVYGRTPASHLSTADQVDWTMQVIGYGLTLPLSDKELLQGCVNVYKDWLTALYFKKRSVPQPLIDNPNRYAPIIFQHLRSLFVPRGESRYLEDHVELCNKVLEIVQALIGVKGLKMSRETWESMFSFLLHICNLLLATPTSSPSLGTSLCEVLIHVLFMSWLRACQDCFPSPNLWKTLRECCCNWRHHYNVIDEWNQLMYSITTRVVYHMYGPKHLSKMSPLPSQNSDYRNLLKAMPEDAVVQCWFRMLHTLGNPVDLLYSDIITSSPAFRDAAALNSDHIASCVAILPNIFHNVMKGVSAQVCLFVGHKHEVQFFPGRSGSSFSSGGSSPGIRPKESNSRSQFYAPTPTSSRKESFYMNFSPTSPNSQVPEYYSTTQGIIGKPTGNTLLHIFGNWLFEAAVWEGQDQEGFPQRRRSHSSTTVISSTADITRLKETGHSQQSMQQRLRDYESGRAEAIGALCTIFFNMPCGEQVTRVYLTRFYHSMFIGLKYDPQACSGQVLTRIMLMSGNLLRKDLPGANVLVLPLLTALEKILGVKNIPYKGETAPEKLRRASISLLLSILPLPLHFIHLRIPDMGHTVHSDLLPKTKSKTFYSLRKRVLKLLFNALETELNATNIQMLLHGIMVSLQDLVTYERSISNMMSEKMESACFIQPDAYKEDISLPGLFRQGIICAHEALTTHSRNNTVTLASLELLDGLARLQFESHTHVDCRDAVQWVCEFIETQAQEKPFLHSKNLHTSIVAAFKTLMVWVMEHPHLLAHESCLSWLLRVTEFGITGQFSKDGDGVVIFKEEKKAHPVSGRVKEIAEYMLYCVMEKFGSFPSPCGAAASGSLLSEEEIIKRLKRSHQGKFKYYLIDNSMILGLIEGSFTDEEAPLPTVTTIIRGPAGRQVWSLQMRQHPRSTEPSTAHLVSQPRPLPSDLPPPSPDLTRPPWPPEVNSEPMKLDGVIPNLDSVLTDPSSIEVHRKICQLLEKEKQQNSGQEKVDLCSKENELEPPKVKDVFDTPRLILNNLGLLSVNSMKKDSRSPSIIALDSSTMHFRSSLSVLDRMPTRYCDSVFVLYCKKGQNQVEDILSHQHNLHTKPQEYVEFLQGMGWIVDPVKHPGFSGKLRPESEEGGSHGIGTSAQIPYRPFPYYADAINEMAFIHPVCRQSSSNSASSIRSVESSDSGPEVGHVVSEPLPPSQGSYQVPQLLPLWTAPTGSGVQESCVQADGERVLKGGLKGVSATTGLGLPPSESDTPRRRTTIPQDCAAIVVWLECYEDYHQFPLERMSKLLHKGYCKGAKDIIPTIFVHKLVSGLYQIVTCPTSSICGPLIDGMMVSRRALSQLVRATAANLCFSHRLENEGYSPPHVKRKRKIEDIGSQFARNMSISEFYTELISN